MNKSRSKVPSDPERPEAPLSLRGHMLLCLQGFRGEGYDERFIANLEAIHTRLQSDPGIRVRLTDVPDQVCGACPHLQGGCTLRGPDFEKQIVSQDRQVLGLLGLSAGQVIPWREITDRIRRRMRGDMLPGICGTCRWLPRGYCQEGIDRLNGDPERSPDLSL